VDKSALAATFTTAEGKNFTFVDVHLCWSRCADQENSTYSKQRVAQSNELLNWVRANFGPNVILAGDFNFAPDYPRCANESIPCNMQLGYQIDLYTTSGFTDVWQVGLATGQASANWGDRDADGKLDMPLGSLETRTHDKRRIDYYFWKGLLVLVTIDVPDLRNQCPHALVADGGMYPACTPEVVQLWDIPDDEGVRPSDHNWVKLTFILP
jgi:endonuclease/exonuclease/phosphatase family metal-dependent hydrolase